MRKCMSGCKVGREAVMMTTASSATDISTALTRGPPGERKGVRIV
jgi:hypothetical protein